MMKTKELVERYVAVWNEPDAERRRQGIGELWSEDAVQVLDPPQEAREAATSLAIRPIFEARGHAELEARVASAYEEFVASGGNSFRPADEGARVADVVTFRWEMVSADGEIAGAGLEFVVLGADGRIRTDYQFIDR
jgi:hypothetical protein